MLSFSLNHAGRCSNLVKWNAVKNSVERRNVIAGPREQAMLQCSFIAREGLALPCECRLKISP